ncbi:hypothetical protein J6590_022564 [Homalodisca vitripennis]|nr:hypothetical protein J6590_022564 [Homalodisca vitripennis]
MGREGPAFIHSAGHSFTVVKPTILGYCCVISGTPRRAGPPAGPRQQEYEMRRRAAFRQHKSGDERECEERPATTTLKGLRICRPAPDSLDLGYSCFLTPDSHTLPHLPDNWSRLIWDTSRHFKVDIRITDRTK